MSLFRRAAGAYLLDRLVRGGARRSRAPRGWGGGHPSYYARRRRPQRRSGFGFWGPFPSYSRRTRRGSQVRVSGCCLPIPLTFAVAAGLAGRAARRRP